MALLSWSGLGGLWGEQWLGWVVGTTLSSYVHIFSFFYHFIISLFILLFSISIHTYSLFFYSTRLVKEIHLVETLAATHAQYRKNAEVLS